MLSFMVLEKKFASDKVEDHTKGGRHDFRNDLMPMKLVIECGIKPDIETEEGDAIKNRKFDEEAPTRLAISSFKDPGRASPKVENR